MAESVESLRRATLEVVELPTDSLDPDEVNPNEVDDLKMAALRRDIVEGGFFQPVIVRPNGKRWTIVDGEHRWRILTEIGEKTIPCVVDDAGLDDARMRMLTMNYLRGKPDPVRLARIVSKLAKEIGDAELRARLGMDEDEYDSLKELENLDDGLDERLAAKLAAEEKAAPEVLRWRLGPRQARTLERVLDEITAADGVTRADALIRILAAT